MNQLIIELHMVNSMYDKKSICDSVRCLIFPNEIILNVMIKINGLKQQNTGICSDKLSLVNCNICFYCVTTDFCNLLIFKCSYPAVPFHRSCKSTSGSISDNVQDRIDCSDTVSITSNCIDERDDCESIPKDCNHKDPGTQDSFISNCANACNQSLLENFEVKTNEVKTSIFAGLEKIIIKLLLNITYFFNVKIIRYFNKRPVNDQLIKCGTIIEKIQPLERTKVSRQYGHIAQIIAQLLCPCAIEP
ncbi:hypothetical protein ACTA71_009056 [Dictyostelium dimigraforme]